MEIGRIVSNYGIFSGLFWCFCCVYWKQAIGTVQIMSVTPSPYGANAATQPTYVCLLSQPDKDLLHNIQTGRHVLRGNTSTNTLALPVGSHAGHNNLNTLIQYLPASTSNSIGVFYCEASKSGTTTRVPVTIMTSAFLVQPTSGQFTVTVNYAETVHLYVNVINKPQNTEMIWEKQADRVGNFMVVQKSGTQYTISGASAEHAGVYHTYWANWDHAGSLIRLIVRGCSHGKWGTPSCNKICDNCYNGGICDDKTGECVCRPGFMGPNCLTACGDNKFGWDCEHECGVTSWVLSCPGTVFCMPDPVGCSCMSGWMGTECNQECPSGMYGAGCTQFCRCQSGSCDRFTGRCSGMCSKGWTGDNCFFPVNCPSGYYGTQCTYKCYCENCNKLTGSCMDKECLRGFWGPYCLSECHCLNGAACDKVTGKCKPDLNSGLSLCESGYVSTGVNLDNCQQSVFCYADCTKTCHCYPPDSCNSVTGQCSSNQCVFNWSGISCQKGIIEVEFEKTNPNQVLEVNCTVTGDTMTPTPDQVTMEYRDDNGYLQPIGEQSGINRLGSGQFLKVTFTVAPSANQPLPQSFRCYFRFQENGINNAAIVYIYPFYVLPTLKSSVIAEYSSITSSSVTIYWNTWNPDNGDTGDGPVIGYTIYDEITATIIDGVSAVDLITPLITRTITSLTPNTVYKLRVRPVREGPGGEGYATQFLMFTTLPLPTQSPPLIPSTPFVATTTLTEKLTQPDKSTPPDNQNTIPLNPDMMNTKSTMMPIVINTTETTSEDSTTEKPPIAKKSSDTTLYIAIGVIAILVLVLIIVIILIVFVIRKRNYIKEDIVAEAPVIEVSSKRTADDDDEIPVIPSDRASMSSLNVIDNTLIDVEVEEEPEVQGAAAEPEPPLIPTESAGAQASLFSTATIKKRLQVPPVDVKDFANYVKGKRQNAQLDREWESLPKNLCRPTTMGKKPENKGKNRFRNVVAYDHSRVVLEPLEDDPDSDYINACYIKGVKNPRAYIASQGPSDITIGDYWRMVWQENISVMVMACNIIETGKLKCVKYWPDKGTHETFGDFDVTFDSEEQTATDFLTRKFTISKDGEGTRKVVQLHYTNWPDKDIPKHCTPVLQLLQEVNRLHQDREAPLLIHCSAGAGRTGAIIAIHAMMEMADQKGLVDIYNFVFSMRNSRANIVQTPAQYTFVHDAILEHLFCKNTFVKAEEFAARLKSLQEQNQDTGNTYLEEEYAILDLVSPIVSSYRTQGSLKEESMSKLRSGDSFPVDSSRPYLMTSREDGDMSPYINAAFMDGYKTKDLFISTQMPLTNTVVDLWRLMYDYNCTCIVQLNAMDHDEEDCPQYWPEEGTCEYGPFSVSLMEKESTEDFEIKTLRLVYTKRDVKSPIPVRHFQYTTWPKDDERPGTSDGILKLISAVEKWQKTLDGPGPIVVLCMNAAGRTGAFCTIQKCLDQVREEQGANVLQNVKQLRINRTNMVDTPAKYLFCYEAILEYLKAFDDYAGKKSYQNVTDVKKEVKKPKEPKKKKLQDDAVIYGNQETIDEIKKQAEAKDEKQSADEVPQGASNVPSKNEDSKNEAYKSEAPKVPLKNEASQSEASKVPPQNDVDKSEASKVPPQNDVDKSEAPEVPSKNGASSKPSPSTKRKSTPPVYSKTKPLVSSKPKPLAKGRPKTYVDGGTKSLTEEGDKEGATGAVETKNGVKKHEQVYQNVAFDTQM